MPLKLDLRSEILVGNGVSGRSRVEMYDATGTRFKGLTVYSSTEGRNAPVHVAAKNIDLVLLENPLTL